MGPLLGLLGAVAVLALAASPATVSAHALLRSSTPAAGATLGSPPDGVTLTFSETPDLRLTLVKVLDTGGTDRVSGPAASVEDPAGSVRVPITLPGDGVFTVSWRAVSSVDGHISAGSFVFGVGQAPPSVPPSGPDAGVSQSGTPPAIGARWLLYLGFMALFGAAWVALAVARSPAPDLLAMAAIGWVLTALGSVAVVGVQWAETGAPFEQLPSTSIGFAAALRGGSLVLVAAALAALATSSRFAGRRGWALVGSAAAITIVVDVITGHAAAGPAWVVQVIQQSAHGIGAAAWLGGLAGLLVALRTTPVGERLATARRYSTWAAAALAIVVVTGVLRAFAEIGTVDALVGTDFGRVVLVKSGLLVALAGLGAVNRFYTLRNASRVPSMLRRVGGAELAITVGVLALSAMLVNLSPPASAGNGPITPAAQPIVAIGHDFGTSIRARLVVTPGGAGANAFDLAITDYDTGAPLDASAAKLGFGIVSLTGIGKSSLDLAPAAAGHFSASGPNLSIDGIWTVTATVSVPGGAVEIPLIIATKVADQAVEQLVSPGLPTIYSVNLGAIGTAQVYLDPGGTGRNELHATFFDAAGTELPIPSATIALTPSDGSGALVVARLLEPGHFVATVDAVAGPLTVDVVTPLPPGRGDGQVHLHVTIEVTP
ncbi:MAG: copper resistance protein CopC [Chloroflexota bacterium]